MSHARSRTKTRSPANSTRHPSRSPHPFLPPSHFAAAAGIPYPINKPSSHTNTADAAPHSHGVLSPPNPIGKNTSSLSPNPNPDTGGYDTHAHAGRPSPSDFNSNAFGRDISDSSTRANRMSAQSVRDKRKSQIEDLVQMEAQLLPSLRDTIDRMTRPPSGMFSPPLAADEMISKRTNRTSQSLAPRSPFTSTPPIVNSHDSHQYQYQYQYPQNNHITSPPAPAKYIYHDGSSNLSATTTSSTQVNPPTPKPKPKPILKPHHLESPGFSHSPGRWAVSTSGSSSDASGSHEGPHRPRKSGGSTPKKVSAHPSPNIRERRREDRTEERSSAKTPTNNGTDPSRRTARTRSRTDPGSAPKIPNLSAHTPQPTASTSGSSIPRRAPYPLTPGPHHTSRKISSTQDTDSEVEKRFETEIRERRKLVVANGVVTPSSSQESNSYEKGIDKKSKLPTLSGRQYKPSQPSQAEDVDKKQSRFGLGFGFGEYGLKFRSMFGDGSVKPPTDKTSDFDNKYAGSSPNNQMGEAFAPGTLATGELVSPGRQEPDVVPRNRTSLANADATEVNRRRQEALRGIVNGLDQRLPFHPRSCDGSDSETESEYLGQQGFAISPSDDVDIRDQNVDEQDLSGGGGDSESEYSSDGEEQERIDAISTEKGDEEGTPRSNVVPRFVVSTDSNGLEEQQDPEYNMPGKHAFRSSRSPIIRHNPAVAIPPALQRYSVYQISETASLASDDHGSPEKEEQRYSSELSRLIATSTAAAARERQAFGIPPSLSDYAENMQGDALTHADSNMSSLDSNFWQEDCNDITLNASSLLRQLDKSQGDRKVEENPEEYRDSQASYDTVGSSEHVDAYYAQSDTLSLVQSDISASQSSSPSIASTEISSSAQSIASQSSRSRTSSEDRNSWEAFREILMDQYGLGEEEIERQRVVWELTQSETAFVDQMQNMVKVFIRPLRVQDSKTWVTGVPPDVARLFDWLEDIVHLHSQLLTTLLGARDAKTPMLHVISSSLRSFVPRLEIYQPYLVKLEFVASLIEQLVGDEGHDFGDFVKMQETSSQCAGLTLEKYLVEPVNRLAQYPEFLRRLFGFTAKKHPDYLSTFSLLHSLNLVIRVLSEVKDREDEYERVKEISLRIEGAQACQLANRERRLLLQGPLRCARVISDGLPLGFPASSTSTTRSINKMPPVNPEKPGQPGELHDRNVKLANAITIRGRSGSVRSTASTVTSLKSFRTASPSFDFQTALPYNPNSFANSQTGFERVQAFVFTDVLILASIISQRHVSKRYTQKDESVRYHLLDEVGISRIFSVSADQNSNSITLELLPLTMEELNTGVAEDGQSMVTISLGPEDHHDSAEQHDILQNWLPPLRQCSHSTLRSLSVPSHGRTYLAHGPNPYTELQDRQPVLSILASGLPLPKSPSLQIYDAMNGYGGDPRQQEREQRGWWSLRFQHVLRELQRREALQCP